MAPFSQPAQVKQRVGNHPSSLDRQREVVLSGISGEGLHLSKDKCLRVSVSLQLTAQEAFIADTKLTLDGSQLRGIPPKPALDGDRTREMK